MGLHYFEQSRMSTPRRIFVAVLPPEGGRVELEASESQHVGVLRLSVGQELELFDGEGRVAAARIRSLAERVVCDVEPPCLVDHPLGRVVLVQALLKGPKLDVALRMATELGVSEVVLVETQRCVAKYTGGSGNKMERVRRVVQQAARQSERIYVPKVHAPISYATYMEGIRVGDPRWIFSARSSRSIPAISGSAKSLSVAVGPEGGFTPDEIELAVSKGFVKVGLGPPILRSETAAAMAVGLAIDRVLQGG